VDVVDITLEGWLACRKMSTTSIQSRACTQAQTQTHTHTHTHTRVHAHQPTCTEPHTDQADNECWLAEKPSMY